MVNLKSASFIVIMLLHEVLTHIHSQIKPRLHFGESFTLNMSLRSTERWCDDGVELVASVGMQTPPLIKPHIKQISFKKKKKKHCKSSDLKWTTVKWPFVLDLLSQLCIRIKKNRWNICRIYNKAQLIENLPETAFHRLYNISPNSTTH